MTGDPAGRAATGRKETGRTGTGREDTGRDASGREPTEGSGARTGPVPAILIPAAGASSRMRGRDKLLETVRGRPLLADRVAVAASAVAARTGPAGPDSALSGPATPAPAARADVADILVTLPPRDVAPGRWAAIAGAGVRPIAVADHRDGLSASLRAGVAALPRACPGVLILPADMPDISAADITALLDAFDGRRILRGASATGKPGHPVLFPASDFAALGAVTGDRGGRELLAAAAARVVLVALPGAHALTDLDTPEDWAAWRARQT